LISVEPSAPVFDWRSNRRRKSSAFRRAFGTSFINIKNKQKEANCTKTKQRSLAATNERQQEMGNRPQDNNLSKRVKGAKENGTLVRIESVRQEGCFLEEASFPTLEGGQAFVEDKVIPLFPYVPCRNDEELHEKIVIHLRSGFLHHSMEGKIEPPVDT
jgi:hypothetical protein